MVDKEQLTLTIEAVLAARLLVAILILMVNMAGNGLLTKLAEIPCLVLAVIFHTTTIVLDRVLDMVLEGQQSILHMLLGIVDPAPMA